MATEPDPTAPWPSMRLDERLLEDYRQTFDLMKQLGFNEISIWGLYVSRSWPVDIRSAVYPKRGAMADKLIDKAHQRGIRVYSGLGVYSWGFEEIIRAHPQLSRGNVQAMCASLPEAWDWMQKVVDFVFSRFAIDHSRRLRRIGPGVSGGRRGVYALPAPGPLRHDLPGAVGLQPGRTADLPDRTAEPVTTGGLRPAARIHQGGLEEAGPRRRTEGQGHENPPLCRGMSENYDAVMRKKEAGLLSSPASNSLLCFLRFGYEKLYLLGAAH